MKERKLEKGVGYTTIFFHKKKLKFELTTKGLTMRRTSIQGNGDFREVLYTKIESIEEIEKINRLGGTWGCRSIDSGYGYIVMEHFSDADRLTGYVRIVRKSKAYVHGFPKKRVEAAPGDWIYYKRRNLGNEV